MLPVGFDALFYRWLDVDHCTGQLISNVPPSIIESFFMVILITGHNFADAERRVQIRSMYERRLKLLEWVHQTEWF